MANIFDYLQWRGDIPFQNDPFNDVDALLLAWFSYADFETYVKEDFDDNSNRISDVATVYLSKNDHNKFMKESLSFIKTSRGLLKDCQNTLRFGTLPIFGYVNEVDESRETQFSAVTVKICKNEYAVLFRGTDDTLIGWKEDFNMGYIPEVPAQKMAVDYLNKVMKSVRGNVYVLGHSKGGNLAIYSACHMEKRYRDRILRVYNFDGPGFYDDITTRPEYSEVMNKVKSFLPQESNVGVLLNHVKEYKVVKADQHGIAQHGIPQWHVMGKEIVLADGLKKFSINLETTFNNWLLRIPLEERKVFIDALFKIIGANGAKTTMDINADILKSAGAMLKEYTALDKEAKMQMLKIIGIFLSESGNTARLAKSEAAKN